MSGVRFAWLASYPRSGNTWMRFLLESLLRQGGAVDINSPRLRVPVLSREELDDYFAIESSELTSDEIDLARPALHAAIAANFEGPIILRKVHDKFWRTAAGEAVFPGHLSQGAIYVVRDPRDVAVSCADFFGRTIDDSIGILADPTFGLTSFDDSYKSFLPQPIGAWSEHALSWLENGEMPVHVVRYEDLIADTATRLAGVARFLGLSEENAHKAAEAQSFATLKRQEMQAGYSRKPATATAFFRQGRAGAWQEVLTPAQRARIERDHAMLMARLGYLS